MQRVSVVGNSGSGKSTVADALARRLGVPHIELDSIFHQPGWRALPVAEFRRRVGKQVQMPGWVVAWSWTQHGPYRDRYAAAAADPANVHLEFVRLCTPGEVRRFLAAAGL